MSEEQRKTFLAKPFPRNRCRNCGTEVIFMADMLAYACPYCGWEFESKTGWGKTPEAKEAEDDRVD